MSEPSEPASDLQILLDVPVTVSAELAPCRKSMEEVLRLEAGALVALDQFARSPVDLYVNRKRVARGEIVLMGENFGIKVTELMT